MRRSVWRWLAAGPALGVAAGLPAAAADDPPMRPTAGVYAFLPWFVVDLDRGAILNNAARESQAPLTQCSDAQQYCIRSRAFELSFPRHCEQRRAFFQRDSRIVASFEWEEFVHLLPSRQRQMHVFHDPQFPHYAFLLDDKGLAGIVFDPNRTDLAAELRDGAAERAWKGEPSRSLTWGRLRSVVPLFECW